MKYFLLIFLAFTFHVLLHGQQRLSAGFFPEMGLNVPLNEKWRYTAKIESNHGLFRDDADHDNEWGYYHYRTDLQSFMEYKLTARIKGAIGYQYRFEEQNTHRTIQQITWLNNFRTFRVGSRLRADQQFSDNIHPEWRIRYRAASDIPLEGAKLDDGEKYFLLSAEFILALQARELAMENRFVTGIGHYFNRSKKLELSLDYRTDPYFPTVNRHRIWCKISFYWNLKGFK